MNIGDVRRWPRLGFIKGDTPLSGRLLHGYEIVAGFALAIIWLQSAAAHTGNPYVFLSTIYRYKIVGEGLAEFTALVLPMVQLVLAICLVGRMCVGGAILLSACLLTVFLAAQVSVAARGMTIDCGCFGAAITTKVGTESIYFVSVLLIVAITALAAHLAYSRSCAAQALPSVA